MRRELGSMILGVMIAFIAVYAVSTLHSESRRPGTFEAMKIVEEEAYDGGRVAEAPFRGVGLFSSPYALAVYSLGVGLLVYVISKRRFS